MEACLREIVVAPRWGPEPSTINAVFVAAVASLAGETVGAATTRAIPGLTTIAAVEVHTAIATYEGAEIVSGFHISS